MPAVEDGGEGMPESFGKRRRRDVKAKKAAAREDRRRARAKRQADRAAGLIEAGPPIAPAEPAALGLVAAEEPDAVEAGPEGVQAQPEG